MNARSTGLIARGYLPRSTGPVISLRAALWPAALAVPALLALAFVTAVWVALHAYEIIWWREARARTRALRVPAS